MKNIKLIASLLVSIFLFSFLVTGCSKKVTAKECAQIFWEMNTTHDMSNISKINLKEKDGQAAINKDINEAKASLKETFTEAQMKFTDAQLEDVCNALIEAYSKLTVKIEEVSNDGNKAEIKFITTYFDMNALDEKASNDALDVIISLGLTDQTEIINRFSELYIKNLITEFKNVSISTNTTEKTYTFVNNGEFWAPEDKTNFGTSIGQFITNQI